MRTSVLALLVVLTTACSSGAAPGAACTLDSDCVSGYVCFSVGTSGEARQCMQTCDPATTAVCDDGSAEGYHPICLERALVGGGVCYTGGTSTSTCSDTRECTRGNTCLTDRSQCLTACDVRTPGTQCIGDQVCMPVAGSAVRGYCELAGGADAGP